MLNRKAFQITMAAAAVFSASTVNGVPADAKGGERPHMDLAFCIDTTGSMQNEIDMVKTKTKELVAKLASGKPTPIVRVGLVAFRDRGDAYVTKVFPFSDDIDKVVKDISGLQAAGGGDGPEAVNEGLHVALNSLDWGKEKDTAKLLFLIGDAGPHDYPNDYKWEDESKKAIARGIQINTIACAGLESYPAEKGADVFRQIAKLTDGKYDTLAYRQQVIGSSGRRETVVTSGGAAFKMRAGETDWKAAAASGKLDKAEFAAAPMASMAATSEGKAISRVRGFAYDAYGGSAGSAGLSRSDSNLDDIVLNAARAKAKKQLKVEY